MGNLELVQLLLSHGADPFLSTQLNDALCYSAAAQYGCYRLAISSSSLPHGHKSLLRIKKRKSAGWTVLYAFEDIMVNSKVCKFLHDVFLHC